MVRSSWTSSAIRPGVAQLGEVARHRRRREVELGGDLLAVQLSLMTRDQAQHVQPGAVGERLADGERLFFAALDFGAARLGALAVEHDGHVAIPVEHVNGRWSHDDRDEQHSVTG